MKIHNKIYRSLTGEPFHTQEINGKVVEFFYMNDTPHLTQFVQKGRFYAWTSDGTNYRLIVEKGFYEKVSYFFAEDLNEVWLNFLEDIGKTNSRMSKIFLLGSLGLSAVIIVASYLLKLQNYGIILALVIVLVANMFHSSKINKLVKQKNYKAQMDIKDILTEDGFERLLKDQDEYYNEYFKFDEVNEDEELDENLELADSDVEEDQINVLAAAAIASVSSDNDDEVIIEEVIEVDVVEEKPEEEIEVVEEIQADSVETQTDSIEDEIEEEKEKAPVKKPAKKATKVDYNTLTVTQLKNLARDLELVGYSTMRKAELIELITNKK